MKFSASAVRRRSFKLHKAILGTSLAVASFMASAPSARAAVVTLTGDATANAADQITFGGAVTTFNAADTLTTGGNQITFAADVDYAANKPASITGGGTIVTDGTNQVLGIFTGAGNITVAGTGTLESGGANDNTGTWTVSAGILKLTAANTSDTTYTVSTGGSLTTATAGVLADTADVVVNGGTYTVGVADTIGTLSGTGGSIVLSANLTFGEDATASTIASVVSGANDLIKQGNAATTLSGTNTFTGDLLINAGTIVATSAGALGASASDVTLANAGSTLDVQATIAAKTGAVTLGADTIMTTSGTATGEMQAAVTVGGADADITASAAGATLTVSGAIGAGANNFEVGGAGTLNISGALTGTGDITKSGAGTTTLSADNSTFTGDFLVTAGTLAASTSNEALGGTNTGGTENIVISDNATLDLQGIAVAAKDGTTTVQRGATIATSVGTSSFADPIGILNAGGAGEPLNVDVTGTQLTLSGVISEAAQAGLTKTGAGILVLSGVNTYTGDTTISGGVLKFGVNNAVNANSSIVLGGGELDLNGFSYAGASTVGPNAEIAGGTLTGTVNATGGSITNTILRGTLNASGNNTLTNVGGTAVVNLNGGKTKLVGSNTFGNVNMNSGSFEVPVPTNNITPLTVTNIESTGGSLDLDASALNQTQIIGDKTIIAGNVSETVASNTSLTFDGQTARFAGFNKPLETPGLYDVQLKQGSLILSIQRKGANDICGVTGLCQTGSGQNLTGVDRAEVRKLYGDILLPALNTGRITLPFWTTKRETARYLISGLMPRNVDAAGNVLSSYNNRLADTLFERLPLRQFEPVAAVEETVIEEVEVEEPVRGLWKTSGEVEKVEVDGQLYVENPSLVEQYAKRDNLRAWARGFGGDVSASQTTRYLYKSYTASNAGGIVGVDFSAADNFQVGAYANYGNLSINNDGNAIAGSGSWNPDGWGGGITADYWTDSFYVQGLIGASAFSGDQDRSIRAISSGILDGGRTLSGEKNVTSIVGSLRAGAPMQAGDFYLEPQIQATWSGNQEDAFSEGGNTNFKLNYKSRDTNFLQTELGMKVAYPIAMGKTEQLVPSIRVAWLGDWNMDNSGQKIGYRFSNRTFELDSYQEDQMGALIEGGLDYTVANIGATSFKVYGRGGAEVWDNERGTNWRASGGVTFQF